MSLWNTAQALGLQCQVVPIMSTPYRWDEVVHLYQSKFGTFNDNSSGSHELDEYGPYWGHKLPEESVTWLNSKDVDKEDEEDNSTKKSAKKSDDESKAKSLKEVQMAYMTVSLSSALSIQSFDTDVHPVWQRAWHRHQLHSCCHAHPHPAAP